MAKDVVRIAQIIGDVDNSGIQSVVMNYYENIDKEKIQFDFYVEAESNIINKEYIEKMGGKVFFIPNAKYKAKLRKSFKTYFSENKYDIMVSHISHQTIIPLIIAKKKDIKVRIAHSHYVNFKKNTFSELFRKIRAYFIRKNANEFISCSEAAGRWMFSDKPYKDNKVNLIPNAIDLERFKFNESDRVKIREKYKISKDTFVVGHVGTFTRQKNHFFLVNTFRYFLKRNPDSVLMLIGRGPLFDSLKIYCKRIKIIDNVIFVGTTNKIEKFYSAFDCFLLPSFYEGLPLTAVEAQVSGLPCIISEYITNDLKCLNSTVFYPISNEVFWADKMNEISKKVYDRNIDLTLFTKFNIVNQSKRVEQLCLDFLEKYNSK